jgi:hypothetical protein
VRSGAVRRGKEEVRGEGVFVRQRVGVFGRDGGVRTEAVGALLMVAP